MRPLLVASLLALTLAALITGLARPKPLEAQLMHLQVEQTLPQYADSLADEPAELQALFLVYADQPILVAKARIALLRYPQIARPILLQYGADPAFQEVLGKSGEDVVLPIQYFLTHEVFTLDVMRSLSSGARAAVEAARGFWAGDSAGGSSTRGPMSSEERGQYAIHFVQAEGYGFIGQFVVDAQGEVAWLQTERVLEGLNRFFAGGLRGLETKMRRDEAIGLGDVGWAAVVVAVGVGAFRLLRMGRVGARAGAGAATGGSALSLSQRSAVLGAGLWRGTVIGTRLVKYGAPAVLAYMAVRHPSIINSLLGSAAEKLGLPVWLVQLAGWTLVLLPVMLLLRFVTTPLAWMLAGIARGLRRVSTPQRGRKSAAAFPVD